MKPIGVGVMTVDRAARDDRNDAASDLDLIRLVQTRSREDTARAEACETLIRRYEPMVRACARRYKDSPEHTEELMQVGYLGLLKAINNFDPELGHSLDAYARPCVTGELKRHFRDKRWQVRVHRSAQELRLRIRDEAATLAQQLARQPTDADLARHLQVSEAEVADARVASQAFQAVHLDTPISQDGDSPRTLADQMGAEDERLDQTITMAAVWQHCEELPKREQMMLMMRFYGNMTQTQIGDELGISQMHVSRLLNHALCYLRDRVVATSD